jgi:MGT family glycosyltransferase
MDDWKGTNPMQALQLAMRTFADRSGAEVKDLQAAIRAVKPELLVIDTNSWGAQAAAEASGLPWVVFQPYFTALPAPGVPPFGPGLPRRMDLIGRLRDRFLGRMIYSKMNQWGLPAVNACREQVGLTPVGAVGEPILHAPGVLYFTSEALEYPRDQWPPSFRFIGPGTWAPPADAPPWLEDVDRPIALVTCSSERQQDRAIVESALQTLPADGLFVVATTAAYQPAEISAQSGHHVRLEQFIPHEPVVKRAEVVVCHGGMGITQRALAHGVPVVVVPFGRDQLEVARRVEHAHAGVMLPPTRLSPSSLSAAVSAAREMRPGAERIAGAFGATGGASVAADVLEELVQQSAQAPGDERVGSSA